MKCPIKVVKGLNPPLSSVDMRSWQVLLLLLAGWGQCTLAQSSVIPFPLPYPVFRNPLLFLGYRNPIPCPGKCNLLPYPHYRIAVHSVHSQSCACDFNQLTKNTGVVPNEQTVRSSRSSWDRSTCSSPKFTYFV